MTIECFSAGILVADHLCSPIDHLPAAGELVLAQSLPLAIGGCAANAGFDLARLGFQVAILGCVGDDPFGHFIIETFRQHHVQTQYIRAIPGWQTSGTLIINVEGEDRRFVHCIGANAALQAEDIPVELVRQAKVFYVGGYLLMPGLEAAPLARLFHAARQAGVKTVLDIVLPGPGDYADSLAPVLAETDVFLPNDDESAVITGLSDAPSQAEAFLRWGADTVVITCGEHGSYLANARQRLEAGIYNVPYVGGTGSGDAFDAGYITGLLQGFDDEGCLRWGSALGASCVRGVGATETVFDRREAEEFIATQSLSIRRL